MRKQISDLERLKHILDSIITIREFTDNISYEDYMNDLKLRLALVKLLEIIGEASVGLSEDTINRFSNIEWPLLRGMRNILIHEYFGVDYKIVWNAIQTRIPELEKKIEAIVRLLETQD
ncbi:MAG: DUF86 domain-containing protein [Bacteroidales bacterium]|nr:DUF86 domain-containing protein [Bacteroidales bacterium]